MESLKSLEDGLLQRPLLYRRLSIALAVCFPLLLVTFNHGWSSSIYGLGAILQAISQRASLVIYLLSFAIICVAAIAVPLAFQLHALERNLTTGTVRPRYILLAAAGISFVSTVTIVTLGLKFPFRLGFNRDGVALVMLLSFALGAILAPVARHVGQAAAAEDTSDDNGRLIGFGILAVIIAAVALKVTEPQSDEDLRSEIGAELRNLMRQPTITPNDLGGLREKLSKARQENIHFGHDDFAKTACNWMTVSSCRANCLVVYSGFGVVSRAAIEDAVRMQRQFKNLENYGDRRPDQCVLSAGSGATLQRIAYVSNLLNK